MTKRQLLSNFGHQPHGGIRLYLMHCTFLNVLSIGCGFLGTALLFSSRGLPKVVGTSLRQVGNSWPSGLIFRQPVPIESSQKEIGTFKKVVVPARAILGGGSIEASIS